MFGHNKSEDSIKTGSTNSLKWKTNKNGTKKWREKEAYSVGLWFLAKKRGSGALFI